MCKFAALTLQISDKLQPTSGIEPTNSRPIESEPIICAQSIDKAMPAFL